MAAIDTEEALSSPERISEVVTYILDHFDQKDYAEFLVQLERSAGEWI